MIYSNLPKVRQFLNKNCLIKKLPKNKKIMIVSPHADDVAVACGGAVSMLSRLNTIIPVVFFSGYRGVELKNKEEAIKIRAKEMIKEAKILSMTKPYLLDLASYSSATKLNYNKDLKRVGEWLEKIKPDIIFLPIKNDLHPRHKLATKLTLKALKHSVQLFFYENSWSAIGAFEFNTIFVFDQKIMAKKEQAIRAHQSQLRRTAFDRAARALAEFRGAVVPEQRIFGYGKGRVMKGIFIEAYNQLNNSLKK